MKITIEQVAEAGNNVASAIEAACKDHDSIASGVIGPSFATSGPGPGWSRQYDASDYAERALSGDYGASSYIDSSDGREATLVERQDITLSQVLTALAAINIEVPKCCQHPDRVVIPIPDNEEDDSEAEAERIHSAMPDGVEWGWTGASDTSPVGNGYQTTSDMELTWDAPTNEVDWSDESVIELVCPSLEEALEYPDAYEAMISGLVEHGMATDTDAWIFLNDCVAAQEKVDEIKRVKAVAGADAFLWLHDSGDCILWPDEASSEDDNGAKAIERWSLTLAEYRAVKAAHEDEDLVDCFA